VKRINRGLEGGEWRIGGFRRGVTGLEAGHWRSGTDG
jgi:hypothetical protein